jgi:hypothetical protein
MWCDTSARTIFPTRKIGVLRDGYEASFLVLNGNPIADFNWVRNIQSRFKQGEFIDLWFDSKRRLLADREADIAWAQSSILKWRLVNRAKLLLVKDLTSRGRSLQLALQQPANSICRRDFQKVFHRRDPFPPTVSSLVRP